jgi:hypothetical protein
MGRQLSPRRGSQRPSAERIAKSIAFQARPQEFDLLDRQTAMAAELHIALPSVHGPSTRMELIRREIEKRGLADHRVRQSRSETWAQAFERVHGEALE